MSQTYATSFVKMIPSLISSSSSAAKFTDYHEGAFRGGLRIGEVHRVMHAYPLRPPEARAAKNKLAA